MTSDGIELASQNVVAVVTPEEAHQKRGWRRSKYTDPNRPGPTEFAGAAGPKPERIKPALKERGATERQAEAARAKSLSQTVKWDCTYNGGP